MTWKMYAGRVDGDFRHFGSRWYVEAYGHTEVVAVELHESPEGAYWGWLDTGAREPEMIWSDRLLFDACFTYGPDAEQERGKGRILRLDVRAVAAELVSGPGGPSNETVVPPAGDGAVKNTEWAESFQIFAKYQEVATTAAKHDQFWAGPDASDMSPADIERLYALGWRRDDDGGWTRDVG